MVRREDVANKSSLPAALSSFNNDFRRPMWCRLNGLTRRIQKRVCVYTLACMPHASGNLRKRLTQKAVHGLRGSTLSSSPPLHSFPSRPIIMLVLPAEIAFRVSTTGLRDGGGCCFCVSVSRFFFSRWLATGACGQSPCYGHISEVIYTCWISQAVVVMEVYDRMIEWPPGGLRFFFSDTLPSIEFISSPVM